LAVPLTIAGEVVGVLDVQSDKVGGLSEADLELLQVLAAQIAISFANARLFAEVRAHAAQLEERVTVRTTEIRSQKERTEAILRSVADAVLVLDLNGRLVLANPVAQRLLEGPKASDLVAHIGRLHAQGGVVSEQLELGAMTLQALASPVTQEDLAIGTVIVLRDITRLRELDRLKSQFVATVSHELRTPLANIKLYLSLMRKGREDRREQYQQVLEQETGRLSDMIEDLLDLSRLEGRAQVIEQEPVEMVPLLERVVENLRPSFVAKGLRLGLEGRHRVIVPINRNQIVRVFTNLLSNALQYTAPGGWVRVKLEPEEQVNGRAMARVGVQDNGQGIAEEDLPYIFERFYRGQQARDSRVPGSGLGLAIVHDIVERHGGRVEAISQLGEGSTFTVWLPLDQGG
jgi:two-component system sensor histidine kinase ResE